MAEPLIEFKNVTKRFGQKTVLDGVNLKIYEGEVTTIIGLSGAGKSVLLKHIIGLLKPDGGEILFRGKPLAEMSRVEKIENFKQISYMFQNNALFDSLTVYENVALPLVETSNMDRKEIHRRVMERIEQMELTEAVDKYPSELSGGMQKRAALARALVTNPHIVLFDEPTSGQDPVRKYGILTMIAQYQKRFGFTAILVSHEIPDVYFISNRILALYQGRIVFQGTPEELEHFDHPFQDEVIKSLEELEQELTGVYSRRLFKVQNRHQLMRKLGDEHFCLFLFTVEPPECQLVHEIGFELARILNSRGGFTVRNSMNEFIAVLPYTTLSEGADMIKNLTNDRWRDLHLPSGTVIRVGSTIGHPTDEINSLIAKTRQGEKEIVRF
ncbi:MAG: ATP-binding cassette domain-containing protein [Syntrophales bacterium]|nr:ATP-binding cassette domain-containing protein [Syntrophales bacterium]